jgi:hypothetical protein
VPTTIVKMKKSSNRSGIEEVNKLTFIVAGRSVLKNNPVWVPVSDIFVKRERNFGTTRSFI